MKRRIIGGKSEVEQNMKNLVDRIKEEDEERRYEIMNNSPHRKPNENVVGGA